MPKSQLRSQLNLSESGEDYLKAIFQLREELRRTHDSDLVTTNALAARLGVAPGSVTGMVKKLADLELVTHAPYRGVNLTEVGERLALELVRHHRLLELYLTRVVGFRWDEVHDQADALEHAISEEFEDRIDEMLGNPAYDPHGDPIPTKEGQITGPELAPLAAMIPDPDRIYTIVRVLTQDPTLLRYLDQLRLTPGTHIRLMARAPFGGDLRVATETAECLISPLIAGVMLVMHSGH